MSLSYDGISLGCSAADADGIACSAGGIHPDCRQAECYSFEERTNEGRKLIRAVLYDFALGKITAEERQRILDILQLTRTTCVVRPEEPIAAYQDEQVVQAEGRPKIQQTFLFKP